jgi:adenylate kinase family enzyme
VDERLADLRRSRRIILIGSGGSGKSWLATRLGALTGYPLYHLDQEFWLPGWVMKPAEERLARMREIVAQPTWIIDGTWGSTLETRFAAADLVLFLDVNRLVCVLRAARRAGRSRPDLPAFLVEPGVLSRASREFYQWIWAYPETERPAVLALHERYPDVAFLRLRSRRAVRACLAAWTKVCQDAA